MKHFEILKRSWKVLWSYKALWLFGIILALTSFSASSSGGGGGGAGRGGSSFLLPSQPEFAQSWHELTHNLSRMAQSTATSELEPWAIVLIILGSLLGMLLAVFFTVAHFVSQVALIRMVDIHEDTSEKLSWRQGFRLGWSKAAWRLFVISFIIGTTIFLVFSLLFGLAALPGLLGSLVGTGLLVIGILMSIGMGMLVLLLLIVIAVLLSVAMETIRRVCVLEDLGIMDSLRRGFRLVREHFAEVGLMWLLTLGVRVGLGFVLIPPLVILGGLALLLGGLIGGLIYLVSLTITLGWVYALVIGGLVFLIVVGIPLTFVGGLLQTYLSTTWTLTYRALTVE